MDRIRVLIADDHPLFREGMHGLLNLDSLLQPCHHLFADLLTE